MKYLLATSNAGKLREVSQILDNEGIELVGPGDWRSEVEETGATFADNALLKARFAYHATGLPAIAEDSGLEVDALNGAPGIYSARYAGAGASDQQRIAKILEELEEIPDQERGARFVCVVAIVWDGGEQTFTGTVCGRLLREARGTNGFGYDPIFFHPPSEKTFAELTSEEKAVISHRGLAFRQLAAWLKTLPAR